MKKILLMLFALMLACSPALAEGLDLAAMTVEELTALRNRVDAELLRREREAAAAAAEAYAQHPDDAPILYERNEHGACRITYVSKEQLRSRLHKVELTTENWSTYLGDYCYPGEYVQTNNFGEVTKVIEQRAAGFHFKEGYVGCYKDVGLKFTGRKTFSTQGEWNGDMTHFRITQEVWKESSEPYTFDLYNEGKSDVHLSGYECTAATGTLYVLEVSPEASRWLLVPPNQAPWISLYVDNENFGDTNSLASLYERLNP